MYSPIPPRPSFRSSGFTLIELLVVISIIAVLAALLIPVLGNVRAQGDAVKCSSNLRQLGVGIQGYMNEHDGRLPGPLDVLVYPADQKGKTADTGSLIELIAPYLGLLKKSTVGQADTRTADSVTICPALLRVATVKGTPSFVLNFADKIEDMGSQAPWGSIKDGTQPVPYSVLTSWRDDRTDPKEVSANGQMNLARRWAIKDVDKHAFRDMAAPAEASAMPEKPVHGEYRNALFYDWHVGRIDLEDKAL